MASSLTSETWQPALRASGRKHALKIIRRECSYDYSVAIPKVKQLASFLTAAGLVAGYSLGLAQTATVTIQANQPAANISSNLFGIFFEEISMAGDGGIYAELVRNRSFEESSTPVWWSLSTNGVAAGSFAIDTSLALSPSNTHALKLTHASGVGSIGAVNNGYYGIPVTQGSAYNLGFYARGSAGFGGGITVSLENAAGAATYAQTNAVGLTTSWQHFSFTLTPNATDPGARLVLRISQNGSVYLDFVSLFPALTFNNRTNGLRPDLANMLVNLKPSFMRFPGGSWVDGTSLANAYHWELTVGDPANRTQRQNLWGYMVDNGLGFHEYLQMCEDIGATPVFCINAGMDAGQNAVPTDQLGPWVQEALDALQYANGDASTYWGAQRAANGHADPFNLQYIEIGNENSGPAYDANYGLFYTAIKSNYPAVHIIADSQGTIPTSAPVEMLDEHYYSSASWFAQNSTHYDTYDRNGPKIFVGEYAVAYAIPPGTFPATLGNALGEAAWMTGLERNSDLVQIASYAPLFCNVNNPNWFPDLIYFNGTNVYGTPSYYVQQMFSLNRGDVVLPTTVSVSGNPLYVSSSLLQSSGQIIVKAVNVNGGSMTTTFRLNGVSSVSGSATVIQLTGNAGDTNSFALPLHVSPVTNSISGAGTNFTVSLAANSFTVLKLTGSGFNNVTNLQLQCLSPIHVDQEVATAVLGTASGQTVNLAGNYAVGYLSLDPTIAAITPTGLVYGTGVGTTAVVASYSGISATQTVQVLPALGTRLIHRYSFNDGTANDSIGSANGTFHNGSGTASIAGGRLNLTGSASDYVDLGPNILSTTNLTMGAVTLEAWATFSAANSGWTRLFDFGNTSGSSGANYLYLSPNNANNGGSTRLAVTDSPGNSDETGINLNNFLGQTNFHVAVVFNPSPTRQFLGLYTNGVLAGSISTGNKHISSLADVFSFLGHSLWSADPGLNGSIDEFRVYDGELDKFQVAASHYGGPDQVGFDPGAVNGLILDVGSQPLPLYTVRPITAYLSFSQAGNVAVIGDANLLLSSDNAHVFTVDASGNLTTTGLGTANLTGVYDYGGAFYTNSINVLVVPGPPAALAHRYSFNETSGTTVADSVGGAAWNGNLPRGGAFSGGLLTLSSNGQQYVQLPANILSNYPAVTIESWVTFPSQMVWNTFFYGFGNTDGGGSGEYYIFCAPQRGWTAITPSDPGYSGEQGAGGAGDFSFHTNLHYVAVYNPPGGALTVYTNGALAAVNNSITAPLSSVTDVLNYIGRSLYTSDPYIDVILDEFRIYNGAMSTNQIAATQVLGPNQLLTTSSPAVTASLNGSNLTLSWPLSAAAFGLMTRTNLAIGGWAAVTSPSPRIVGTTWQVTLPISGTVQFFRLQE